MIKRLLLDLRKWSEFDRELEVNKDKEITQDMCDRYCKITELALELLREYDEDKYNWYDLNGTIGNEIALFADAIECYLTRNDKAENTRHIDDLLDEIVENYDEETIAHDNAIDIKRALTNCFKVMLHGKDEHDDTMDKKIELQEEIDKDDVYNGMMLMLNCMITYMPWLQDVVNEYYESEV